MERHLPRLREPARPGAPATKRRRSGGFSLLEVMIAFAILTIGVVGATAGQVVAMRLGMNSRTHTLAMHLAEQQMEIFRGMTAADVTALVALPNDPNNPIDPDPNDGNPMAFVRYWLIEPDTPEAGVIRMTVNVDWTDTLGNVQTARVQGLKADP